MEVKEIEFFNFKQVTVFVCISPETGFLAVISYSPAAD